MRKAITPMLPFGETRRTYTSCEVFMVSTNEPGGPLQLTKNILLCFVDLPQQSAASLLGMHKSSLMHVREKFGFDSWPYKPVMCGLWKQMTKQQVVDHREKVILDLEVMAAQPFLPGSNEALDIKHAAIFLRILRSAALKASVFWRYSGKPGSQAGDKQRGRPKKVNQVVGVPGKKQGKASAKVSPKPVGSSQPDSKPFEMHVKVNRPALKLVDSAVVLSPVIAESPAVEAVTSLSTLPLDGIEEPAVFWPLITDQFNFDCLFGCGDVEDVLLLGPIGPQ